MIWIISKENRALWWALKRIPPEIIKVFNQDCSFDFKLNLINNKRTCKTKCLYKRTGYCACCHDFMILYTNQPISHCPRDHVLLVVNVASQCGLTKDNYKELVELDEKYRDSKGLKILAFPCNQFGGQVNKHWQYQTIVRFMLAVFRGPCAV